MAGGSGDSLALAMGEYGLLLTEMGPTANLDLPVRSSPRIKYTCMAVSKRFIVMGANTGGLYLFDRLSLQYLRLMGNKDGSVLKMAFAKDHHLLGVATSLGIILVWYVGSRVRGKPKFIKKSEEHKGASVLALCWDDVGARLFAGDSRGFVTVTNVPPINMPSQRMEISPSVKKFKIHHPNVLIAKAQSPIVQLDYAKNKLLVSTITKCVVLELESLECTLVGTKPREGLFGACFLEEKNSGNLTIYTARPGSRLWEASVDGQVLSTQQYKKLLAVPPGPILGFHSSWVGAHCSPGLQHSGTCTGAIITEEFNPQAVNFAKLLLIRDRYLVTWHGHAVYILDPVLGQVVSWHKLDASVSDICCHGNNIYVQQSDDQVSWYSLLSVKECVASLFEMRETKQCAKVAVECKHYVIPGSARDLVPEAMITKLRELLDKDEECKDLVADLEGVERSLEPETVDSTLPPGSRDGEADSPETLSVCSDVHCDEPCGVTADSGVEDDDSLSVTHGEDGTDRTAAHKKPRKKISLDVSLEKMFLAAAAKAKQFAQEKQIGRGKLSPTDKSASAERADGHLLSPELSDSSTSTRRLSDQGSEVEEVGSDGPGSGIWREDSEGVPLVKETASSHSDEGESRLSGSDITALEDERKDKFEAKDKKKKKRRVTTVDIDGPHRWIEGVALMSPEGLGSSSSQRGTYSSFGNTKVAVKKDRALSDSGLAAMQGHVATEARAELTPAIPAMLSKARGLLKKLKTNEDAASTEEGLVQSEQLAEASADGRREATLMPPSPPQIQELVRASAQVRSQIRDPAALCDTKVLREILTGWLSGLHSAAEACGKLGALEETGHEPATPASLKSFLEYSAVEDFNNVSFLARMCFDLAIYGQSDSKSSFLVHQCTCSQSREHKETASGLLNQTGLGRKASGFAPEPPHPEIGQLGNRSVEDSSNHSNVGLSPNSEFCASSVAPPSAPQLGQHAPLHSKPQGTATDGMSASEICDEDQSNTDRNSKDHSPNREAARDALFASEVSESRDSPLVPLSPTCTTCSACSIRVDRHCPPCSRTFDREFEFVPQSASDRRQLMDARRKDRVADWRRAAFLFDFFDLLDVTRVRRTLRMTAGCRRATWHALLLRLQSVATQDSVCRYVREGHVTRALHEVHEKAADFRDALLYHVTSLYQLDSRQTVLACARMFPDIQPWEVSRMCRHVPSRDAQLGASDFLLYVKELIRWRAESGAETRQQIVASICRDADLMASWFHDALVADGATRDLRCDQCGEPRPGSHRLSWQHGDQLVEVVDLLCRRPSDVGLAHFMNLCWKHGYWSGLLRLMVRVGLGTDALNLLVQLGDVALLAGAQSWGVLPQSLSQWRHLLERVASRARSCDVSGEHACAPWGRPDWVPTLSWEAVTQLALEQLGACRTVDILKTLACPTPPLESGFYYKCVSGAVIEKKQRFICHGLVKKLDSYLWSQRTNALPPKLNAFRELEQSSGSRAKDDPKPLLESFAHIRTLEDAASPWGVNLRLVDSECAVCSRPLCERIAASNQGLLVFDCGHVFHKQCVQEGACLTCFYGSLASVGATAGAWR